MLETFRECLQDVFDLLRPEAPPPGAEDPPDRPRRRRVVLGLALFDLAPLRLHRDVHVRGRHASRRAAAQALSLDRDLLRELLGQEELRDLLDAGAWSRWRSLIGEPKDADQLHDLLLRRGDLRVGEFDEAYAAVLETERRAIRVRVAGEERC